MKHVLRKKKYLLALCAATLATTSVWANDPVSVNDTQTVADQTITFTGDSAYSVGLNISGNKAVATVPGTVTVNGEATNSEPIGVEVQGGGQMTAKNLVISMKPADGAKNTYSKGLMVRGTNSQATIDDLKSTVVFSGESDTTNNSPDSNASYGVVVGYNFGGGAGDSKSTLTTKDATIDVSNTANSKIANYIIPSSKATATFKFGHQLSGIRIIRTGGATPEYISNGNLNVTVTDKSSAKIGDYLVGLYINGDGSQATLNGSTNITVKANGAYSAGIKIGKPTDSDSDTAIDNFAKGASVISNGKLIVDTTETKDAAAIRLFDKKSTFKITGNELSEIKSANSAIVFDTQDYKASAHVDVHLGFFDLPVNGTPSRNSNNFNNLVELNNTKLSTTSDKASLILVNGQEVSDAVVAGAKLGGFPTAPFNTGNFNVTNAKFILKGDKSEAFAPTKGWLMEVNGATRTKTSDLTATFDNKAKIKGLTTKGTYDSLALNVNNGAVWTLVAKEEDPGKEPKIYTAKASSVTLDKGILDATHTPDDPEKNPYVIDLNGATYSTSDGATKKLGTFTNGGVIDMSNKAYNDRLNIIGNYVGKDGILRTNLEWNSPGDDKGADSKSDHLDISDKATGTTKVITVNKDGKEEVIDGTIGSIKADLNKNSAVVVSVHKPDGIDNAFVGKAKTSGAGELQLTSRLTDEGVREYYWTITQVNPEKPKPEKPQPEKPQPEKPQPEKPQPEKPQPEKPQPEKPQPEKPQPEKPQPILDPVVPGYVEMPRIDMDVNMLSLDTLHQRRGENNLFVWDHFLDQKEKSTQIWARYIKNYSKNWGNRLGYDLHTDGIQIGKDFKVTVPKEADSHLAFRTTGAYITFLHGYSNFYDNKKSVNGKPAADFQAGHGQVNAYTLGLTHTKYMKDESYVDLVGQVGYFSNNYHSIENYKASNKAWGLALSAETGKHKVFKTTKKGQWAIEPQAQLVYQSFNFSDMNDSIHQIQQDTLHGLHARLGLRLSYDAMKDGSKERARSIYGIANIWKQLSDNSAVHIGKDTVSESYASTVGEIGFGGQVYLKDDIYLYGDLRYAFNLGGSNYRNTRGIIGLKYTF